MEQLGEAGLAARRGGPSRERRPDPRRGRPEKSAPPRQRRPLVSGRSPRIAMRDEAAEPARDRPLSVGCCWIMRSEEHTSELQSLMRPSYAVFCLKQKKKDTRS